MKKIFLIIAIALLTVACSDDKQSTREYRALSFLNDYMPLCDFVDYSQDYFVENIFASFKAKDELPWGKNVPEREFRHFVLPIRVNNENLDDFRTVYYDELYNRVKDLSMYDAVLEVNHWCHEKVNYRGSDSRTSSPMATIKTSWGRCGEESTLLVAALRTVCIPARQVYVPRWAHCDDNHAWVEAWVDGKWHFLGACEPEPVLDLGWFNAPASRALLVHTRVFGNYDGPEEVIDRTANYTEINVIGNYAETAKLNVKIVDRYGKAVPDARVDFKIYNYSEYHTVATKYTDNQGYTWLTAGLGKMMVYASKDGNFGFDVVSIGATDTLTIILCKDAIHRVSNAIESYNYDIIPPTENAKIPEVSAEMREANNERLAKEDFIRNFHVELYKYEKCIGDYDENLLGKTWGNCETIQAFIDYARTLDKETEAYKILNVITDKDLRDVTLDVLIDCLDTPVETRFIASHETNDDFYFKYIVNPRVSNEMLRPYRAEFAKYVETLHGTSLSDNVDGLIQWVRDSIEIRDDLNARKIPMSPAGVMRSRVTDSHSRDIFFVALARTSGIPSRIDPVTGKVQYYDNQWIDVDFIPVETHSRASFQPGTLVINYQGDDDPQYYTYFSIKKFNGNTFDLLAYDAKDPGMDVGMTLSQMMAGGGITLDEGYYVMSFGSRLADGSVLNRLVFFWIESGETTNIEMKMRKPVETRYGTSQLRIVALLDSGSEPTTHIVQELSDLKEKFEKWGGKIEFLFQNKNDFGNFKLKGFNELPSNVTYSHGFGTIFDAIPYLTQLQNRSLPIIMVLDEDDNVVYASQGYKIGVGEQILKCISE